MNDSAETITAHRNALQQLVVGRRPGPRHLEVLDVVARDLIERGVFLAPVRAAVAHPVTMRRVGVRDGRAAAVSVAAATTAPMILIIIVVRIIEPPRLDDLLAVIMPRRLSRRDATSKFSKSVFSAVTDLPTHL